MKTELFTEANMPFNLISQTIAAPVKILSPREEEAARAATVRAGGYEHTPSMFDALFRSLPACHQDSPQHAAYVARDAAGEEGASVWDQVANAIESATGESADY